MRVLRSGLLSVIYIISATAAPKAPQPQCNAFGKYTPIEGKYVSAFRNQINLELEGSREHKREVQDVRSASIPPRTLARRMQRPPSKPRLGNWEASTGSSFTYVYSDADLDRLERQPLRALEIMGAGGDLSRQRPTLLQTISAGFCGLASYCPAPVRRVPTGITAALSWLSILLQNFLTFWFYKNDEQQRKDKVMMLLTAYVVAGAILFTNLYSVWNTNHPKQPSKFAISMEVHHRNGILPPGAPEARFVVDDYSIDGTGQFIMTGHREVPIPQLKGWLQYSPQPSEPQPSSPRRLARRDGKYDDFCAPSSWNEWKSVLALAFLEIVIPMMRDGATAVTLALAHWGRRNNLKVSHGGQTLVRWWLSEDFDPRDFHILRNDPPTDLADVQVAESTKDRPHQECFEFYRPSKSQSKYDAGPPPKFWERFTAECKKFNKAPGSSAKSFYHFGFGWEAEYFDDGCKEFVDCQSLTGSSGDAARNGEIAAHVKTCFDRSQGGDGLYHGGLVEHNIGSSSGEFKPCGVTRIRPLSSDRSN